MNAEEIPEEYLMDDEYFENQPLESCPRCDRSYDEIDFEFQMCSKCGWDAERNRYDNEIIRKPTEDDYMNGDADFLTDNWY